MQSKSLQVINAHKKWVVQQNLTGNIIDNE